jgi:hypothetical protein
MIASLLFLGALSVTAFAQRQLAVNLGINTFTAGETRDLFGGGKLKIGLSPAQRQFKNGLVFDTDFDLNLANQGGNKFALIPFTFGVASNLTPVTEGGVTPYLAVRAGVAYADYSITRRSNGIRYSEKRLLPTANFEFGVNIQRNLTISARYNVYQKADGFDFNGLSFQAAYSFGRF